MAELHRLLISPPLINASCAWASELDQLLELYASRYTGGVTTRTATLSGFQQNDSHTVSFHSETISTINSYEYSPHPLSYYLNAAMLAFRSQKGSSKPFIISITSPSPDTLSTMLTTIQAFRFDLGDHKAELSRIGIEFNCSCPNVKAIPPPGYNLGSLIPVLQTMADVHAEDPTLTIGLKLPPYLYLSQFQDTISTISSFSTRSGNPFKFITCTNTLGNSILFGEQTPSSPQGFALPTVTGGMAGEMLHPLALGNVHTFKTLIDASYDDGIKNLKIIGVGGVTTPAAVARMRHVGATIVGCATLLGKEGVSAFELLSQ